MVSRLLGRPVALGVALAVTAAAVLAAVSLRNERTYTRLLADGDQAMSAADLGQAIEAYTGAITLNPDSMVAHLKRGLAYRQRRELDRALRDLRRASDLDPSVPRVFEWQGEVSLELRRFARAAERFEDSVRLDDRQPEVHYKLAVARYMEGRAGAAIAPVTRALGLAPNLAEAHYLLGLCLRDLGRLAEADGALANAARLAPGLVAAREARADVHLALGRTAPAVDELAALAALEPDRAERAVAVAAAWASSGRLDTAASVLGRAAERFPDNATVLTRLGDVWLRTAESDPSALGQAVSALTKAVSLGPAPSDTLTLLGHARLRAGDVAGAEREFTAATTRQPVAPEAYRALADLHERQGRHGEALAALTRFVALAVATPAASAELARLGDLAMRVGDPVAAAYWYERAMTEREPSAGLFAKRAEADLGRGDLDHARQMVRDGLLLAPREPRLVALARRLDQSGQAPR